jgi:hypothetical protein
MEEKQRVYVYELYPTLAAVPGVARDDQWRNKIEFFSYVTKKTV